MYKYLVIILLFIGCSSPEEIDKQDLSIIYNNAKDFYKNKDYDLAYTSAYDYWVIVQKKGYRKETGNVLNLLGAIFQKQRKSAKSLESYLKALDIKEMLRDSISMSKTYNNIGAIYEVNGAYEESIRYHFKAIKIRESADEQNLLNRSYRNVGLAYKKDEQYDNALQYFSKSLEISEIQSDKNRIGDILNHMAICHEKSYDYSKAILYYNKALKIQGEKGNKQELAGIYNNLAIVYMKTDSSSKAKAYALKSIEIKEQEGIEDEKVYTYNTLSDIYHKQGLTDKVIEYAEKAIPIAEKYSMEEELLKAYEHASEGYLLQENDKKSIEYLKKSRILDKSMNEQRERFYETALSQRLEFEEVEKQHAIHKASTLNTIHLNSQRNYYLIAIFIGLALFTGFGIVLSKKHRDLKHVAATFPAEVQKSLAEIGGISFFAKHFPEDGLKKLAKVDRMINSMGHQIASFTNRVNNGIYAPERFDPGLEINGILDNYESLAQAKKTSILKDVKKGYFINIHKKTYLRAVEILLRDSLTNARRETVVIVEVNAFNNALWVTITGHRPYKKSYMEDPSILKKLQAMGGTVSIVPQTHNVFEITIAFDLA